jgi:hypothetical protein
MDVLEDYGSLRELRSRETPERSSSALPRYRGDSAALPRIAPEDCSAQFVNETFPVKMMTGM